MLKKERFARRCLRDGCKIEFEIPRHRLDTAKYCSRHCKGVRKSMLRYGFKQELPEANSIVWSKGIAYTVGIIATDGTLRKNRNTIKIGMKDKEVIEYVRNIMRQEVMGRQNLINIETKIVSGKEYILYSYSFTSPLFYKFCLGVGLMPNKSLQLGELCIPKCYFPYFLLGVIDGDGNFNRLRRELKMGEVEHHHIRIFSGSADFLYWLNKQVSSAFHIKSGSIVMDTKGRKNPKYTLFWSNREAVGTILKGIYHEGFYVLERKYELVKQLL